MLRKISSLAFVVIFYLFLTVPSYAQTIDPCPKTAGGGFNKLCDFDKNTLAKIVSNGVTILFIVATIASLFFLIFGGIRWITSGGDKAKLEESRNMLVAAAVGLIITFASYFILNIVLELFGLPSINTFTIPSLVQ